MKNKESKVLQKNPNKSLEWGGDVDVLIKANCENSATEKHFANK